MCVPVNPDCLPMSSTVKLLLVLATVLLVLAWPALSLWRSVQVQRVYAEPPARTPAVSAQHLAALRKLRFAWNALIEGGGPVVDPQAPYGSKTIADDLGPIIGTRDPVSVARFHREVSAILIDQLRTCALAPGHYGLAHLDNAWMEQRLRQELAGLPDARIAAIVAELPRLSPDRGFAFTDQHRLLLRNISFDWPDESIRPFVARGGYPAPIVDFKRPFGDMTAFDIDMAAILGLPRPADDAAEPALARLYWEMWPALQAFVEHAPFETCGR